MSRPRRYGNKAAVESFSCPVDIKEQLRGLPNKSEFIVEALREKIGVFEDELLNSEIRRIDIEISKQRSKILDLELIRSQKEAILRSRQSQKVNSLEARIKAIEILKSLPEKKRESWLQSRIDVLNECDWKTPEEALAFMREAMR